MTTAALPKPRADYDEAYTAPVRAELFDVASQYLSAAELETLERACAYAFDAHAGQDRKSGEPYITHPISVTTELALWHADIETLCAGLMHDVLEDTPIEYEQMAAQFGTVVADLVNGVSKLEKFKFSDKAQHQAESFRKLVMAMTQDVRVIIIKLADRLHNMRTLKGVKKAEKRRSTAEETLQIHAPIAHRLGLNQVYREMQDLAFEQIHPDRYRVLKNAMAKFREQYGDVIQHTEDTFRNGLAENGIEAQIIGREKHLYSIHEKMLRRKHRFKDILDMYSFRVVVGSKLECYTALGVLHMLYRPDLKRFKDHIAIPKSNSYQSLHTSLKDRKGLTLEVQIRTRDMHAVAEGGITAILEDSRNDSRRTQEWLQNILNLQEQSENAAEFLESVKTDLFQQEVYLYTPKGKIITLPRGSTPVDFAYYIHTDIGHHCIGAKVNKENVALRTPLRNGDQVEIFTSVYGRPSHAWLDFVKSARAKSALRQYLKHSDRNDAISLGKSLLDKTLESMLPENEAEKTSVRDRYTAAGRKLDDLYYRIGNGELTPVQAFTELTDGTAGQTAAVSIDAGAGGVRLGLCCLPVAGDRVRALMVKGEGVTIHREDCGVLLAADPERQWDAGWQDFVSDGRGYNTALVVSCRDRHGLLARLTAAISDAGNNINRVETLSQADDSGFITFRFDIRVKDLKQLEQTRRSLLQIDTVLKVRRV